MVWNFWDIPSSDDFLIAPWASTPSSFNEGPCAGVTPFGLSPSDPLGSRRFGREAVLRSTGLDRPSLGNQSDHSAWPHSANEGWLGRGEGVRSQASAIDNRSADLWNIWPSSTELYHFVLSSIKNGPRLGLTSYSLAGFFLPLCQIICTFTLYFKAYLSHCFFSILSISYLLYLILLYFTNRNGVARCKKMGVFPSKELSSHYVVVKRGVSGRRLRRTELITKWNPVLCGRNF